ncbi:unnamed protein product, partial [Meganyctiphanes norvegica]
VDMVVHQQQTMWQQQMPPRPLGCPGRENPITGIMEETTNNKGGSKIIYRGQAYTVHKRNKNSIRWKCSKKDTKGCGGSISTDNSMTTILREVSHNHVGDDDYTDGIILREEIKAVVRQTHCKPGQVVKDICSQRTKEVIMAAGSKESLKQVARRVVRGKAHKNSASREEIPVPLPDPYAENVLFDNGSPA